MTDKSATATTNLPEDMSRPYFLTLQENDWRIVEKVVPVVYRAVPFQGVLSS